MRFQLHDVLFALTWVTLVALPLALIWVVLSGGITVDRFEMTFPEAAGALRPGDATLWLVFAIGLIPWVAAMLALWHVQALFALFRAGRALSDDAALRIRKTGACLVAVAGLGIVAHTLQILVATLGRPPGQRTLAISIDSGDAAFALAGGLMVVIGRAMAEAARAVDENKSFV